MARMMSEVFAHPCKGRAAYGNLHSYIYREPFKRALNELSEVFPDRTLTGKFQSTQINLIIQRLATRLKEVSDDVFHAEIQKYDNTKAMDDKELKLTKENAGYVSRTLL